ncbi:MAG: hypothetical protein U1D30_06985 [Planctomycetota bacterium]
MGEDRYVFAGLTLGSDTLEEPYFEDPDTLDFSDFGAAVTIDLSNYKNKDPDQGSTNTPPQIVSSGNLSLRLWNEFGVENVVGSDYDDLITGTSSDNDLSVVPGETPSTPRSTPSMAAPGMTALRVATTRMFTVTWERLSAKTRSLTPESNALDFSCSGAAIALDLGGGLTQTIHSGELELVFYTTIAIDDVIGAAWPTRLQAMGIGIISEGLGGKSTQSSEVMSGTPFGSAEMTDFHRWERLGVWRGWQRYDPSGIKGPILLFRRSGAATCWTASRPRDFQPLFQQYQKRRGMRTQACRRRWEWILVEVVWARLDRRRRRRRLDFGR